MKGSGEDEVVVCGDLLETWVEFFLINEASGFVDDYQCEDDPS